MQIDLTYGRSGWCVLLTAVLFQIPANAQQIRAKTIDPPTAVSVKGSRIAVRTVDPSESEIADARIRWRLCQPWGRRFRCSNLQQLVAQLNKIVPTTLNDRSLDEIGLTASHAVTVDVAATEKPIVTLARTLKSLDLTWTLRGGRCTIESVETAEYGLIVRVYDVTPLVIVDTAGRLDSLPLHQRTDFNSLIDLIQTTIHPDTWEALGGPSSFGPIVVGQRCLLVIATTTAVHLEIESLLHHLNRLGYPNQQARSPVAANKPSGLPRAPTAMSKLSGLPKFGRTTTSTRD